MLRGLDVRNQWRSLAPGFWPSNVPFGKRTIVYGHNGSGKSTIADLILSLTSDGAPVDTVWEDEGGTRHRVSSGAVWPAGGVAVFTKRWVEDNLAAFLDGESASAIVTLGREAISAIEEEQRLAEEIISLGESANAHAARAKELGRKAEAVAKEVQNLIVGELEDVDRRRFTKHRYNLPTVKADLAGFRGDVPSPADHATALMRLGEGDLEKVATVGPMPNEVAAAVGDLDPLLAETPSRQALASLDGNPQAQRWVEEGRKLHEHADDCLFCGSPFTGERRAVLTRHFDESWMELRSRATSLRGRVQAERAALEAWVGKWPDPVLLAGELRADYESALEVIRASVAMRVEAFNAIEDALREKEQDPGATPLPPDRSALSTLPDTDAADAVLVRHNQRADNHERLRSDSIDTVLDHLLGSHNELYLEATTQGEEASDKARAATEAAQEARTSLRALRDQKLTTSETATMLTEDLARAFGRGHLSVRVTDDGKSYTCWRGDEAATHLSDGERTTLSLLYFLRQLDDEATKSDPAERIVVIDDPSSSLDRESVFATHQWLLDALESAGQFIVFTHDFSLLRLFLKSQKSQWDKSNKKLQEGDLDEKRYPRVAFVECFAGNREGQRTTQIAPLPDLLRKSTSEYAYLFSMVMKGLADPSDHERLFLLPNAARRVLETFATFRTPDIPKFDQQLRVMIEEPDLAGYRDVYDFCNRWSHGEGNEVVDALDARAVVQSIRRCMQFLRAADQDHFRRLCRLTDVDESVLD